MKLKVATVFLGLLFTGIANAALIPWTSVLTPDQEVPPTSSEGGGLGGGLFNTTTGEVSWLVGVVGLTANPVAAHFHNAAPGVNGPVILNIGAPAMVLFGNALYMGTGFVADLASQVSQFLAGNWYLNVHTPNNPGGEIRGQVVATIGVPAPGTLLLMLLGVGLVGARVRYQRQP